MARQYADQVEVVGVASRDTVERFEAFVDTHDLQHVRHLADVDGEVWQRFGVVAQPAWAFVDAGTGEVEVHFGSLGAEGFAERLGSDG